MELTGPMAPNDRLNDAEKLFEGEIDAPEGLAVFDGELYTGNRQGDVLKILNGKMIKIANIGHKCGTKILQYQNSIIPEHFFKRATGRIENAAAW
jgi:Adipocyte plasma membrane-associated protein-like, N-terminal